MNNELKRLLGRDIDLLIRRGVERSRNYIRRKTFYLFEGRICRVTMECLFNANSAVIAA